MHRIISLMAVIGLISASSAQTPIHDDGLSREFWVDFNNDGSVTSADALAHFNLWLHPNNPDVDLDGDTDIHDGDVDSDGDVDIDDYNLAVSMITSDRLPEDHVAFYTDAAGRINSEALKALAALPPTAKINGFWKDSYCWSVWESVWDTGSHSDTFANSPLPSGEWPEHQALIYDVKPAFAGYGWITTKAYTESSGQYIMLGALWTDSTTSTTYTVPDHITIGWVTGSDNPFGPTDAELSAEWSLYGDSNEPAPTRADYQHFVAYEDSMVMMPTSKVLSYPINGTISPTGITFNGTTQKYEPAAGQAVISVAEDTFANPISFGATVPKLDGTGSIWFDPPPVRITRDDYTPPTNPLFPGLLPDNNPVLAPFPLTDPTSVDPTVTPTTLPIPAVPASPAPVPYTPDPNENVVPPHLIPGVDQPTIDDSELELGVPLLSYCRLVGNPPTLITYPSFPMRSFPANSPLDPSNYKPRPGTFWENVVGVCYREFLVLGCYYFDSLDPVTCITTP